MVKAIAALSLLVLSAVSVEGRIVCGAWSEPRDNVLVNGQRVRGRYRTCHNTESLKKWIETGPAIAFTGGFGIDGGANPRYTLEPAPSAGAPRYMVHEDASRRTTATFTLLAHWIREQPVPSGLHWQPFAVGLGIGRGAPRLMAGTSIGFGQRFVLTPGVSLARRNALPEGLSVGQITSDPNALDALPKRYDVTWSVALSYRFSARGRTYPIQFDYPH